MFGWEIDTSYSPGLWFRQGDLIRFSESDSPLNEYGIIVTADCDLEKRKHAKYITLVPVVSPLVVLERYLLPEDCERKLDYVISFLTKTFALDQSVDLDVKLAMFEGRLGAGGCEAIVQIAVELALGQRTCLRIDEYLLLMEKIKSVPKKTDALISQMQSRGDILVLPDTRAFGISAGVAWMRHVWQVPASDIALKTSEVGKKKGEKLARLDSPFRYRLTQLMGQVFSDIGLPDMTTELGSVVKDAFSEA